MRAPAPSAALTPTPTPVPTTAPAERRTAVGLFGIGTLAVLYVIASALGWPLGTVAIGGAFLLVHWTDWWLARSRARYRVKCRGRCSIVGRAAATGGWRRAYRSRRAVGAAGRSVCTSWTGGAAARGARDGRAGQPVEQLAAALVAAAALGGLPPGIERSDLAAAVIVRVNLANLTTIGSLATMLWLVLMRRYGIEVSPGTYFRVGVVTTVPALLATVAGLWIAVRLIGGA